MTKIKEHNLGGVFLFIGKKMLHEGNMTVGQIYENHKDTDGFLYLQYSETNPFWYYIWLLAGLSNQEASLKIVNDINSLIKYLKTII